MTEAEHALPLPEEEFQELEEFLASDAAAECMDPEMLDGFITAIAIGPKQVPPAEWLPWVWDEEGSPEGEPVFESAEQRSRIVDLLHRYAAGVVPRIDADVYVPLVYQGDDEESWQDFATPWCEGFLSGMGLRVDAWDALTLDPEGAEFLDPIVALSDPEGDTELEEMVSDPDMRDELVQSLPDSVAGIYRFWQARRAPAAARAPGRPRGSLPHGGGKRR